MIYPAKCSILRDIFVYHPLNIDEALIKKIKDNDRKAILDLYKFSFNVLMGTAVRYKNNQEDQMTIVNNAFIKIIQNLDKFSIGTAYLSWVKRIVRNEVIDSFRKETRYKELFNFEKDEAETGIDLSVENEIEETHEAEELQEMLNTLPPATKLVFNLYAVDGYETKEICEELDISYETVKWHIKEARKRLRIQLKQKELQSKG